MAQAINCPIGLNVFGSALIRVTPDVASINLAVVTTKKQPKDAFQETREQARTIREYLSKAGIRDVQSSRVSLAEEWNFTDSGRKKVGYTARIAFNLVLDQLDRMEEVICDAVEVGANEVGRVIFKSSDLKKHRATARKQAVAAAQQKARIYADAAEVTLGQILHIEDVNPRQLGGESEGSVAVDLGSSDDDKVSAIDPGSICVGAAVILAYSLSDSTRT